MRALLRASHMWQRYPPGNMSTTIRVTPLAVILGSRHLNWPTSQEVTSCSCGSTRMVN